MLRFANGASDVFKRSDIHLAIDFKTAFYNDDSCQTAPHEQRTVPAFRCVNLGSQNFAALAVTPNATFQDENGTPYGASTLIYASEHCKGYDGVLGTDATVPRKGCEAFDEKQIKFKSFKITTTKSDD